MMSPNDANAHQTGAPAESFSTTTPEGSEPAKPVIGVRLADTTGEASADAAAEDTLSDEVTDVSGESATLLAPGRFVPLTPPLGLPAFPGMSSVPTVAPLPTQETPALRITHPLRPGQRLTHPLHPQRARKSSSRKRPAPARTHASTAAFAFLRVGRLFVGVALLSLAWGGAIGIAWLAFAIADALQGATHPVTHIAIVVVYSVVALWLVIMTGACILVSAFALRLGLAQHGW